MCFCCVFLLPQKSHECGFIFIPCHKNYRKQPLILKFHTPSSPYDIALTLHRWSHIMSTCPTIRMMSLRIPDDTDATEEICITHMLYLIFSYHARIPRLDRCGDSTGQLLLVFYEIYRVGDTCSARCRINFARKGILVCVF
jgi:hypothetical protein